MEEIKDFESFYEIKIEPQLEMLKKQNSSAESLGIWMVILAVVTGGLFVATITGNIESGGGILTAFACIAFGITVYHYTKNEDAYTGNYKKNVIEAIVEYLHPQLDYKPEGYVSSKEYKRSSLYRKRYDHYSGDDLLQGQYKDINFYCSEIHTQYRGGSKGRLHTIFKGMFFVAGVDKELAGGTYVWTRGEDQFANSIADERYRLLPMPEVIELKLHNQTFENYFCTCSTNPVEARQILTPEMMELLVNFRKQLQRKIVFSLVAGRCYVAVPIDENLLEPSADPTDKEEIKKHFFYSAFSIQYYQSIKIIKSRLIIPKLA